MYLLNLVKSKRPKSFWNSGFETIEGSDDTICSSWSLPAFIPNLSNSWVNTVFFIPTSQA